MSRPRILDLFSGAGGCGMGYYRAGFDVVGVDIKPQRNYPFLFVQADALEFARRNGRFFDAIHASPPCQASSRMRHLTMRDYVNLIPETRELLNEIGKPYVIENVEGADLRHAITLCGTMFDGVRVRRHRLFEINPPIFSLLHPCRCKNGVVTGELIGHRLSGGKPKGRRKPPLFSPSQLREAIGVPWMTTMECRQAIPPAYTEFLGRQLLAALEIAA